MRFSVEPYTDFRIRHRRKIKVIANKRHTVDPNGSQLAGLLKCFPMAETVDVIWELSVANTENTLKPTARFPRELPHLRSVLLHMEPDLHLDAEEFIPRELAMLFRHLPLSHLKKLDIDLIDMLGDDRMGALFDNLRQSFHYLDGSRLEVFRLQLDFDVMGLPVEDLWVRQVGIFRCLLADAHTSAGCNGGCCRCCD